MIFPEASPFAAAVSALPAVGIAAAAKIVSEANALALVVLGHSSDKLWWHVGAFASSLTFAWRLARAFAWGCNLASSFTLGCSCFLPLQLSSTQSTWRLITVSRTLVHPFAQLRRYQVHEDL